MKIGLEVHFQLDVDKKLFCECSTSLKEKNPIKTIVRKLHPVESELSEIDVATKYEFLRDRVFVYEVFENECCEVETDEEPPHSINKEALKIALQIAMLFNCYIPSELHVMRKIVTDGSNVSGFQRTLIVGVNGHFFYKDKKIEVKQITLEEDAASLKSVDGNKIVYKLNRLGIPLVEISTGIIEGASPSEIAEIALTIGNICFSTKKVKKVLGSIRQDVNISTEYFGRVEIKGIQEIGLIKKVIEKEVERQKKLDLALPKNIKITSFLEIIGNEALKNELKESLLAFGYDDKEVEKMFEEKTFNKKIIEFLIERANSLIERAGEVRAADENGNTKFLRPLPTAARMYPETDIPIIQITDELKNEILKSLPETLLNKEKRFLSYGMSKEIVTQILKSEYLDLFEKIIEKFKDLNKNVVANFFVSTLKDLKRREGLRIENLDENYFLDLFDVLNKGLIVKEALPEIVKYSILNNKSVKEAIDELNLKKMSFEEVKAFVKDIVEKTKISDKKKIFSIVVKEIRLKCDIEDIKKALDF
ncbi:MAG: hypothetical protein RMJ17_04310 [Candidatus Aenigmarchaeota archaeon]|nr:hypothetical protein [Candidatus Aenigmarchaeota archaeon]MDW8149781.1 hypothetical protein [Candidatus Aenigmarchaeota archaeon]